MRSRAVLLTLLLAFSLLPDPASGAPEGWSNLQKDFKGAFKRLDLPKPDRLDKQLRPQLPAGIVIEPAPFHAIVSRLLQPMSGQLDLRDDVLRRLAAHPTSAAGRLVKGALRTTAKENENLAERIAGVEAVYAAVFNRGYMESGERQRGDRKLAAVLIPLYRSLLLRNAALVEQAATALAGMEEGEALGWLVQAAQRDADPAFRRAGANALGRIAGEQAVTALRNLLVKDADAGVRHSALSSLFRWPLAEVEADVVAALRDRAWEVRALAVAACRRGRLLSAVGPLIEAVAAEDGRLLEDLDDALHALVDVRMHGDVGLWRRWWEENRERVAAEASAQAEQGVHAAPLGPPESWVDEEETTEDAERRGGTSAFYGIVTQSKRILFVVDISRSMDSDSEAAPPVTDGTDHPYAKPRGRRKLDIARWQLHRALHDLPDDATANIVVYSESYAVWQEEMTRLKKRAKTKAHAFVDRVVANGTTNICDALDKAWDLAGAGPLGRGKQALEFGADTVFLLSDGDPNRGRVTDLPALLDDAVGRHRRDRIVVHTIGIGEAAGSSFLRDLARRTGGRYVGFP